MTRAGMTFERALILMVLLAVVCLTASCAALISEPTPARPFGGQEEVLEFTTESGVRCVVIRASNSHNAGIGLSCDWSTQ